MSEDKLNYPNRVLEWAKRLEQEVLNDRANLWHIKSKDSLRAIIAEMRGQPAPVKEDPDD